MANLKALVAVLIDISIPTVTCGRDHGPEDTPSVDIVTRHLNKSFMHRLRSVEWDKGFEAGRETPGFSIDKHNGNSLTAILRQSIHSFARLLPPQRPSDVLQKRDASALRCLRMERSNDSKSGQREGGQVLEYFNVWRSVIGICR